jgi:hypothetical protein
MDGRHLWGVSKVAKWRKCPAVGKEIKSAECGANRNSVYVCPSGCEFNPFAPQNYDELLEMEAKLDRVVLEMFREISEKKPWLMSKFLKATDEQDHLMGNLTVSKAVFVDRDESGKTRAERFVEEGLPGLRNDQEIIFKAKMGIRPALIEAQEVVDGQLIRGIDLLRPEEGISYMIDRGLAKRAVRFGVMLVFTYELPGLKRVHGAAYNFPSFGEISAEEVLKATVRHAGGPEGGEELRAWFFENAQNVITVIAESARARYRKRLQRSDVAETRVNYEMTGDGDEGVRMLLDREDIEQEELTPAEEDKGYSTRLCWFKKGSGDDKGSEILRGTVLIEGRNWALKTKGKERMAELRRDFEAILGGRARFVSEEIKEAGEPTVPVDEKWICPSLLEGAEPMRIETTRVGPLAPGETIEARQAALFEQEDRAFLEKAWPQFGGLTPREAANSPAQRPKLIRAMKERIRVVDERNLRTGGRESIDWIVNELGLREIAFAPPPTRPIPEEMLEEADEEFGEKTDEEFGEDLPAAPLLPIEPISTGAADARLNELLLMAEKGVDLNEEFERSGGRYVDEIAGTVAKSLNDVEMRALDMAALYGTFILVPLGHRIPEIDPISIISEMVELISTGRAIPDEEMPDWVLNLVASARQPLVTQLMAGLVLSIKLKEKEFRDGSVTAAILFLAAYFNELDRKLRPDLKT